MKGIYLSVVLFALLQFPLFAVSSVSIVEIEGSPTIFVDDRSGMPLARERAMSDADFGLLCSLLKEESFDKERVKMIRVACIGNHFSSRQCAEMLSFLSFDSNRLEALKYLAPRICDKRACEVVLKVFAFGSNREKAEELLVGHRRR